MKNVTLWKIGEVSRNGKCEILKGSKVIGYCDARKGTWVLNEVYAIWYGENYD